MDRRDFVKASITAGSVIALSTAGTVAQSGSSNRAKFRIKYAPH